MSDPVNSTYDRAALIQRTRDFGEQYLKAARAQVEALEAGFESAFNSDSSDPESGAKGFVLAVALVDEVTRAVTRDLKDGYVRDAKALLDGEVEEFSDGSDLSGKIIGPGGRA